MTRFDRQRETLLRLDKKRPVVLAQLHPELRRRVERVLDMTGHRLAPWEGYRGREDQERARLSGASEARFGQSPHNFTPSLACDLVLDPRQVPVRAHLRDERYPDLWDDETPEALAAWEALERACEEVELERVLVRGRRDRPHVQLPKWRSLIPT
jgi:hypothetical protein